MLQHNLSNILFFNLTGYQQISVSADKHILRTYRNKSLCEPVLVRYKISSSPSTS